MKSLIHKKHFYKGKVVLFISAVTNPIDVIKIRMQLDQELAERQGNVATALRGRYYRGFLRGLVTIVRDEGILGLYKG